MTRHPDIARSCNRQHASYLFQQDRAYDPERDTGDTYVQCARKPDVLKLRLMLTAYGEQKFHDDLEHVFSLAQTAAQRIANHPHFFLLQQPTLTNICFRRLPPHLRGNALTPRDIQTHHDQLHSLTAAIKTAMLHDGRMMVNYQPLGDLPNFFRLILIDPHLSEADIETILTHIDSLGQQCIQ